MEPDVRYCTAADGVRIAYTVTGEGPVFVSMIDPIVSHVGLEWLHPGNRSTLEAEARYFTLVRFDPRGSGLSERVLPTTVEDLLLDLDAVVSRLQLSGFTLHANTTASPIAIAYAARHPDLVARLVIINGLARTADLNDTPQAKAVLAAAASDWETATEAIGAMAFGPGREESRTHGEYIRTCVTQEYFLQGGSVMDVDVTDLAAMLTMPVLVVRHSGVRYITDQMTQDLVSTIPDARLLTLGGTWLDDPDGLARRIAAFVNEDAPAQAAHVAHGPSGVRTVLFTDLVGHTEMMRRLGDVRGRDVLREHERIVRGEIAKHDGTEIKSDGDGFMISFGSVASAMECAVSIQRAAARRNEGADEPILLRMGMNAGEPIEDAGDLFGESVILAARIGAQADSGEILVPETVRHLLAGKGFTFADRGTFVPKGFDDEVRLFEVRWRD